MGLARILLPILAVAIKIGNGEIFRSWPKFARALGNRGGLVEAHVGNHIGSPTVNLTLEPAGQIKVLSTHEQIFCPVRHRIGTSMPATSAPSDMILAASEAIGQTCWAAGEHHSQLGLYCAP